MGCDASAKAAYWHRRAVAAEASMLEMRGVLGFVVELVDLAPSVELVGRWDVLRVALVRYLASEPLCEDELRARLPSGGAQEGGQGDG